jgi:hypothetical protein
MTTGHKEPQTRLRKSAKTSIFSVVGGSEQCPTMSHKTLFAFALVGALAFPAEQGVAQNASPLHQGSWPIQNGFNRQPTEYELKALHEQDISPDQAREVDRLYDELLMSTHENNHHTGIARSR